MIWNDDYVTLDKSIKSLEDAIAALRNLDSNKKNARYDHQKSGLERDVRNKMKQAIAAALNYT